MWFGEDSVQGMFLLLAVESTFSIQIFHFCGETLVNADQLSYHHIIGFFFSIPDLRGRNRIQLTGETEPSKHSTLLCDEPQRARRLHRGGYFSGAH